jgi:hypothetical protein
MNAARHHHDTGPRTDDDADQDVDHHRGLDADLARMLTRSATRRQSLRWLFVGAGSSVLPLAGCGGGVSADDGFGLSSSTTTTGATSTVSGSAVCSVIPEETGGPYPGDGTNRNANGVANALVLSGIVRSDIRSSVATARPRPARWSTCGTARAKGITRCTAAASSAKTTCAAYRKPTAKAT